jgi:hypothetical protein
MAVDVTMPKFVAATMTPMMGRRTRTKTTNTSLDRDLDNIINNNTHECFFWLTSNGRGRDNGHAKAQYGQHSDSDSCSEDKVIISCASYSILICLT